MATALNISSNPRFIHPRLEGNNATTVAESRRPVVLTVWIDNLC